jgi:hypothetical protein
MKMLKKYSGNGTASFVLFKIHAFCPCFKNLFIKQFPDQIPSSRFQQKVSTEDNCGSGSFVTKV